VSPAVIAVFGGKGGIGKTTTASNLAYLFGRDGHRTLAVDANVDQLSMQVIYDRSQGDPPYDLTIEERPELLSRIQSVKYDRVVIDCPPSRREAQGALEAADRIVVPYVPKFLETRAIVKTCHEVLSGRPYRVLFVAVPAARKGAPGRKPRAADHARESLIGVGIPVYSTMIRNYVAHETAQASGVPVFLPEAADLDKHAPDAAEDYEAFYKELLAELGGE
jgi:chromosome partitioning protein